MSPPSVRPSLHTHEWTLVGYFKFPQFLYPKPHCAFKFKGKLNAYMYARVSLFHGLIQNGYDQVTLHDSQVLTYCKYDYDYGSFLGRSLMIVRQRPLIYPAGNKKENLKKTVTSNLAFVRHIYRVKLLLRFYLSKTNNATYLSLVS